MKYRYTKYTGDELDDLDLEDLVAKLSDLLLASGFGNPYGTDEDERTLQALHDPEVHFVVLQQLLALRVQLGALKELSFVAHNLSKAASSVKVEHLPEPVGTPLQGLLGLKDIGSSLSKPWVQAPDEELGHTRYAANLPISSRGRRAVTRTPSAASSRAVIGAPVR